MNLTTNTATNPTGRKVLVTGSRGKSSIVRFLHAAMQDAGFETHARITGVLPRELGPRGIRNISRSSTAHVEEMRWWLKQLPASSAAIILENSAITQELQGLAGQLLHPDVTILSNVHPDHQEVWGPTKDAAIEALSSGIPEHARVILPAALKQESYLLKLLERRSCRLVIAESVEGVRPDFQACNMGLAMAAIELFDLDRGRALQAMQNVKPDIYDFRVLQCAGAEVAMAFSANDISSTRVLFKSLTWSEQDTRLLYNHRRDRPARLRSFISWMSGSPWKDVLIIGDKPRKPPASAQYLDITSAEGLRQVFEPGDRVFGCGNIAGLPLSLSATLN